MEIIIPFARINAINPNLSSSQSADNSSEYYKCIIVSFMSFRKFNPNIKLVLATNFSPPNIYSNWLIELGVEIRIIHFDFEPPREFGEKFKGCFYIFDVLRCANENALYIDPDVFCIREIGMLPDEMGENVGVFEIDFPADYEINGLTQYQASKLWDFFKSTTNQGAKAHKHLGGEALYVPKAKLVEINSEVTDFWRWNKTRAANGEKFLTTEEHILTNLLKTKEIVLLNRYLSRIWTARSFTEHQGNNLPIMQLSFWHLPSEKTRGFRTFYELLESGIDDLLEMDNKKFVKMSSRIFHIDFSIYVALYQAKRIFRRAISHRI
jgi:hypothetical protein